MEEKMDPIDYLRRQMRLEGKGFSKDGWLESLDPDGEAVPCVLFAKAVDGRQVTCFGGFLPGKLRMELAACPQAAFPDIGCYLERIRSSGIPVKVWHYKTYMFSGDGAGEETVGVECLSPDDKRLEDFGFHGFRRPAYAVLRAGKIISACVSARQNDEAAESWVFTSPEYRRMGLARKTVTAWALDKMETKIIPFYSHAIGNLPSAGLAGRMGLTPLFEEISIDREK
jgi:GNAT superfamily N-acetyltransferase